MMPVKNVQDTVRVALASTLKALPTDAKIVVWDDGSTDATTEIVGEFVGPQVQLIVSEVSVGGGAARDAVIRASDSEFLASMDGDDICFPWRFHAQLRHADKFDAVFMTNIKFGKRARDFRPGLPLTYGASDTALALVFHNPLTHPSFLGRREALEWVGGYRDLKVAQDYDLWMRIAASGRKIGRLGVPGIAYRQSVTQVSRQGGYVERIRRQPEIVHSFISLLDYLSPGLAEIATSTTIEATYKTNLIEFALRRNLPRMAPMLRPYYQHLMDRGRMGPLWGSWAPEFRLES